MWNKPLEIGSCNKALKDYKIDFYKENQKSIIEIEQTHSVINQHLEQAEILRRFLYEGLMIGVVQTAQALAEHDLSNVELRVDWSKPIYHQDFLSRLPKVRFNQEKNQICYSSETIDLPTRMADQSAFLSALSQCEAEQIRFSAQIQDIALRVRAELVL